jgi:hypothetical protein
MEERKKVSVKDWIAQPQHLRHITGARERKEMIWQWVTVAVVACTIIAVMVIFGEG